MTQSFRARIMSAGLWTAGSFATQRIFQLLSNLILTRLLFPEAFGLMALANVFLIGLAMFSDVGIRPAIVQNSRGDDEVFFQTAWTIQVIRGFSLWLAACAIAYPASKIYGQPILWPLVSALGSTSAISGFSSISMSLCARRLMMKNLTIVSTITQITSLILTVIITLEFNSVWSLAFGNIIGSFLGVILSHTLLPKERHRFYWDATSSRAIVHFGRWIFVSTAMTFMAGHGLRMLQGLLLTPAEFGILSVAQTISAIPTELIQQITNLAIFPALSEAKNTGHEKMVDLMHKAHKNIMIISISIFLLIIILSNSIIILLYDARYHNAAPQLTVLSTAAALSVISQTYQSAIMAMGETRLSAAFNAVSAFAKIIMMLFGYKLGGIHGMLWGVCVGALVSYAYVAHKAHKRRLLALRTDVTYLVGVAGAYFAAAQFGDAIAIYARAKMDLIISLAF